MQEWHRQLVELVHGSGKKGERVGAADAPLLLAADMSFDTFDGFDTLSEVVPQLEEVSLPSTIVVRSQRLSSSP